MSNDAALPESSGEKHAITEHVRPNISRLEAVRETVAHARKLNWPYRRIATYLAEERGMKMSAKSVRLFCIRRKITKGRGETELESRPEAAVAPPISKSYSPAMSGLFPSEPKSKSGQRFVPREGPLRTKSNGLLKNDE